MSTSCGDRNEASRWKVYTEEEKTYPLPANDIPPEVRQRLHPWVAGFIGLTPAQADARLAERWAAIERPSLKALRDTLGEFEVKAITDHGEGGMIFAYRPDPKGRRPEFRTDDQGIEDSFLLPGPLEPATIREGLKQTGLGDHEGLNELLYCFGGLSEEPNHGRFEMDQFTDSYGDDSRIRRVEKFTDAVFCKQWMQHPRQEGRRCGLVDNAGAPDRAFR